MVACNPTGIIYAKGASNIMSKVAALDKQQIEAEVAKLPNWSVKDGKLHAEFHFENFVEAFAFMTKVAFAAEAAQHHPEWSNVYNRVTIKLVTHDAGDAISQRDIDMARQIDALAT
jgi:4a-hydroxytetrahydrobiopterin dehydratase